MDALTELCIRIEQNRRRKQSIQEACKGKPVCCPPKRKGIPNFNKEGCCTSCGDKL